LRAKRCFDHVEVVNTWLLCTFSFVAALTVAGCDRSEPPAPSRAQATVLPAEKSRSSFSAATLEDAMVAAKVKAALIAGPGTGKALSIGVASQQNVVTLSGTVASEAIRSDAERVARTIEGVKHIRNNLTVKQPS
jgi:hypothetical protein